MRRPLIRWALIALALYIGYQIIVAAGLIAVLLYELLRHEMRT